MKDRLTTAPLPMERPQGFWNAPWRNRNRLQLLERPPGLWNVRKASGTRLGAIGTARRAILYCSLAGDIISGGERFSFRGPQRASLEWGEEE